MSATTQSAVPASPTSIPFTTGSVTARDGVIIGYRQLGQGPGLIMLHGSMESAASHMHLAAALADAFTVTLVDRRGRGLSGPYGAAYSPDEDVADLEAVLTRTDARYVFGVSSGAIICLRAALRLPGIERVAVYEPALFLSAREPQAVLVRFDREMAAGKTAAAMVTAMLAAQMGPAFFRRLPRWLLTRLTTSAMASEAKNAKPGDMTMSAFAPTLHYDFAQVAATSGQQEMFRAVRQPVLLLGGSESPDYLKRALVALAGILPQARRVELPRLDHGGSSDPSPMNRNGHPEVVARELRQFFASGPRA